ncbi:hypothetical protein [Wenzhou hepe-like virus 1]|uniref:hypothetical protein n=1 Tax=Wenzhou hepe-like virus 1 TaxID=1923566 RepID=UPI00090A0B7F|nr:hypothetical protein [Wenzhou hepe-like virus 1]APG77843.1 hypothetical protein [Wenzhou hepe-like virus 1]
MSILDESAFPGQAREGVSLLQQVNWEEYYQATQTQANTINIGFMVKPEIKALVHKVFSPLNFEFAPGNRCTDHPIPAIGLAIGKHMLDSFMTPETLCIGQSFRNINDNSVHNVSARDFVRAVKASKHTNKALLHAVGKANTMGVENVTARYTHAVMNNVYDIEFDDLPNIMEKTGLTTIHAVMILPNSVAFGHDSYDSELGYGIAIDDDKATMYFKEDRSWAYTHRLDNWRKWVTNNVSVGEHSNVFIERTNRFGPMHLLTITRTPMGETVTGVKPNPYIDMVEVIDFCGSADHFAKLINSYYTSFTKFPLSAFHYNKFRKKLAEIKAASKRVYIPRRIYDKLVQFVFNRDDNMMNRNAASVYLQGQIQTITVSSHTLQHGYELSPQDFAIVSKNAFLEAAVLRYNATKQIAYFMNIFSDDRNVKASFFQKVFNTIDIAFMSPFDRAEDVPMRNVYNAVNTAPNSIIALMFCLTCDRVKPEMMTEEGPEHFYREVETMVHKMVDYDPPSDGCCVNSCMEKILMDTQVFAKGITVGQFATQLKNTGTEEAYNCIKIAGGHATINVEGNFVCEHSHFRNPVVAEPKPLLLTFDEKRYPLSNPKEIYRQMSYCSNYFFTDDEQFVHWIARRNVDVEDTSGIKGIIAKILGRPFLENRRIQSKVVATVSKSTTASMMNDLLQIGDVDAISNIFCDECYYGLPKAVYFYNFDRVAIQFRPRMYKYIYEDMAEDSTLVVPLFSTMLRYPTNYLKEFIDTIVQDKPQFYHVTSEGCLVVKKATVFGMSPNVPKYKHKGTIPPVIQKLPYKKLGRTESSAEIDFGLKFEETESEQQPTLPTIIEEEEPEEREDHDSGEGQQQHTSMHEHEEEQVNADDEEAENQNLQNEVVEIDNVYNLPSVGNDPNMLRVKCETCEADGVPLPKCGHVFCVQHTDYKSCRNCAETHYEKLSALRGIPDSKFFMDGRTLKVSEHYDSSADKLRVILYAASAVEDIANIIKEVREGRRYTGDYEEQIKAAAEMWKGPIEASTYHGVARCIYENEIFGELDDVEPLDFQIVEVATDPARVKTMVANFINTLRTKDEKYKDIHDLAIKNAKKIDRFEHEATVKLGLGIAGCGKTTDVLREYGDKQGVVVVVPYAKLKQSYSDKGMIAYTIAKFLSRGNWAETIILDEAFAMHPGFLYLAMEMAKEVVLVGDDKQLDYNDGTQSIRVQKSMRDILKYDPNRRKRTSYSMPNDIIEWVRPIYNMQITTVNHVDRSVNIMHDVAPRGSMVFTEFDERAVGGITVAKSQGLRYDEVNLYYSPRSKAIMQVHGQKLVAVSRHTRRLNLFVPTMLLANVMGYPRQKESKRGKITAFFGESYKFSNFNRCVFDFENITYTSSEQAYMAEKARFFADETTLNFIMRTNDPREIKRLGRNVRNFDQQKWDGVKEDVMYRILQRKFELQSYRKALLDTGDDNLVEASPTDGFWGAKASLIDVESGVAFEGLNKLGNILCRIREEIKGTRIGARTDYNTNKGFYGNHTVRFEVGNFANNVNEGVVKAPESFYTNLSLYAKEPVPYQAVLIPENPDDTLREKVYPYLVNQTTSVTAVEEVIQKIAYTDADNYTSDRDIYHNHLGNIRNNKVLKLKQKRGDQFSETVRSGFVMGGKLRGRPCYSKNLTQELHCAVERYMKESKGRVYSEARAKADRLYKGFCRLFDMSKATCIDVEELSLAIGEQVSRIQAKGIQQDEGTFGDSHYNTDQIKFHLKQQVKADLNQDSYLRGSMDDEGRYVLKAGQGISATPKTINHIAAGYIRAIEGRLNQIKKPFVHFGYGHTKEQFKRVFAHGRSGTHSVMSVDIKEQDTTKGLWTQLFTDRIYAKFGVPIVVRKALKNIGSDWKLEARDFSVMVEDFFQSGRPDTLLDNTLMTFGCLGDAFKLKEPRTVAAQGDDGYISAKKITMSDDTLVQYKINRNSVGDFVGYLIGDNEVYLDIPRLAVKLMNRVYTNASELEEYKTAVSDWLDFIDNPGHAYRTSLHVAHKYEITVEDADTLLAFLYNFSRGDMVPPNFRTATVVHTTITQKKL